MLGFRVLGFGLKRRASGSRQFHDHECVELVGFRLQGLQACSVPHCLQVTISIYVYIYIHMYLCVCANAICIYMCVYVYIDLLL